MQPLTPNLLEPLTPSLLSPTLPLAPPTVAQTEDDFREFGDTTKTRNNIYQRVLEAAQGIEPVVNDRHTLRLTGVDYQDSDRVTKRQQKEAILGGMSRGRRLRGTWELLDNASGQVLDSKQSTLMTVPHMTERGTFINKGTEYTLKNQQRLLPGVYTRIRDNGEIESHANIMPGKGVSHRYFLDPEKGVFKIRLGQGTIGLTPLLKAMGARPEQLKEAWGKNLFSTNYNADDATEYTKLKQKFLSKKDLEGDANEQQQALVDKFAGMELDPEVTKRTLGTPHKSLTLDAILDITKKLVAVSKGEAEPDDRDSLTYQQFVGPEDLFAERIKRDKGGLRRQLLWKASGKGNLQNMPSSALNKQLMAALMTSGLGQCFDDQTLVLTDRGFILWSEAQENDRFACLIDGKVAYRKPIRLIRERYSGEMIGCRTKVFSYLVTPNHRCYYRSFQRAGRPVSKYKVATAEELFGKQRCHLTTLGERDQIKSPKSMEITWKNDRHGHCQSESVPMELWVEYLGWWLAEGSAFKDGSSYKAVVAQSRSANPRECDRLEDLLDKLPFNWRLSSNGSDYIITNKGLCKELMSYGTKREKRIPRYVFDLPVSLLGRLFDAYMLGDGHEDADNGWLKSETMSLPLAHDLVELWGLLGGTAQISPHNTPTGVYWVVSYSKAIDRFVESSTLAKKQGYDPHFRQDYDGMVYCAEVPGNLLYVMRDGKPHWSHNSIEEINPAELYDKATAVSRLGEGGIPSIDAIPQEARSVQPSMLGYIDPVRTPESGKVGVDTYLARGARKGKDGKLYSQFRDVRTGELKYMTPQQAADLTIAFPDGMDSQSKRVAAMRNGKMTYVNKSEVDMVLPAMEEAFNPLSNIIPMKSQVKGQRLVMASRMTTQALPIVDAESPWVQSAVPGTDGSKSYEELYSKAMGSLRAPQGGVVKDVNGDELTVRYDDGSEEVHDLYQNFPFNRKTFINQTPTVQPGDRFDPDQLLAYSNFTDKGGATALGRNARTAYVAWQGKNFEDAVVVSEGFARKMSSEHMYQHDMEVDDKTKVGKRAFLQLFPGKFDKKTLENLDSNGVIKPGTVVKYGDPLILGATEKESAHNRVHKKGKSGFNDATVLWNHHDTGTVTDVVMGKKGPTVVVKATSPIQTGDKLSGRYGDKGVIADVIPDSEMPHDGDGQPFEVLLNPLGVITRTNPAQMAELLLGKIAAKRGKPIKVQDFDSKKDMAAWVMEELGREGLSDLEDILDPSKDQKIKGIATGSRFFMKLHHTAESKGQSRGGGSYTMEDSPAKGGEDGSKRIGMLDTNALLSHGATATLQDVKSVRGQKNDDYWMQFMSGYNPQATKVPFVYKKFVNQLRAAGVNVIKQGTQTNIMALTDKDIDEMAGDRELKSADGVDWGESLKEIPGGLFDKAKTGGHGGNKWSYIGLQEPMPNPVMEEPIRRMLGLTKKDFEAVISGEKPLGSYGAGPGAIKKALGAINLDAELLKTRNIIQAGRKSERDDAVKKLGYLKSAKKLGLKPEDYVLSKAPVIPPMFRPVSMMGNGMPLIDDANHLYKELFEANTNLRDIQKELGNDASGPERLATYKAFKAVTGLGDPINQKSKDKNVRGILQTVFGSSPKFSTLQRKLISTTVDNVGRAVITPNPDLDMDSVGLPEEKAFKAYEKFVSRRLVRQGMSLRQAREQIRDKTELARNILIEEMDERPVYISRAPVLHKFGIMAMKPRLTKGNTLQVSPLIVKGFNADFDGDAMNYHVPSTEKARKEAIDRLLPSRNLFSLSDFKSVMHAPANEYVGGLFHATKSKSKRPKKIFRSTADAKKAYERGDISIDDRVQILES